MSAAIPLDTTWSLGVLVGLPIWALWFVALFVVAAFGIWQRHNDGLGLTAIAAGLIVVSAIVFVSPLGYWPFKGEYHQWSDVSGQVQQIDKRLVRDGDGMADKFVIQLADEGGQYACDDTRCAQIREGDTAALSCKRAWQYTGTDGYDCRFVSSERAR